MLIVDANIHTRFTMQEPDHFTNEFYTGIEDRIKELLHTDDCEIVQCSITNEEEVYK